jgi:hypothetical protein
MQIVQDNSPSMLVCLDLESFIPLRVPVCPIIRLVYPRHLENIGDVYLYRLSRWSLHGQSTTG